MEKQYYQIEEVAQKTGLTKRAIRHYEEKGLIAPERTEAQYRLYSDEDVERITQIKSYKQSIGFTLSEIKDVFDLEETIRDMVTEDGKSPEAVNKMVSAVKEQIQLIEKKEAYMKKVKQRYQDVLSDLSQKYHIQ
jgi:DNA-binding transcriptional MerR regulator